MSQTSKKEVDELTRREQSAAYKLLAPTFVIIFLVAVYPLGSAFLKSFTNETFASSAPTKFVGLDNYFQLLGLTFRTLPPKQNFTITSDALTALRGKQVPEEVMAKLLPLQDAAYKGQDKFDDALNKTLGEDVASKYRGVIDSVISKTIERDPATRAIIYESPVQVLPRKPNRYREVGQFSMFGARIVLGARDPAFILAVKDTVVFSVCTVFLETVFGLLIALLMNTTFPGRGAMRALMLVPWAIPTVISSRAWQWMFQSTRAGFFNVLFEKFGLGNGQMAFLQMEAWQMPAMVAIDVWKTTPFMALLILAGLQLIPDSLYEAADVDGASKWLQFKAITLPMLKPTIAVALVFRTLDALRVFDVFQIVMGQSRYSMGSYIYYQLINSRATGYSSAGGVIVFVLIFAFAMMYIKTLGVQNEAND